MLRTPEAWPRALRTALVAGLLCGCAAFQPSLYEQLGGRDEIAGLVDVYVGLLREDARLKADFLEANIPRLKLLMTEQLCAATGGPCTYTGAPMRPAHSRLRITEVQFDAALEDLGTAMQSRQVPIAARERLLAIVSSLRPEIVSVPPPSSLGGT